METNNMTVNHDANSSVILRWEIMFYEFIFPEANYSEEQTRDSWFLPFGKDFVTHPKYFPPSMLESESISFDQGRPIYAPAVKEPKIPAVLNGIEFGEDIEHNTIYDNKKDTGEMHYHDDMQMCILFDNSVTKNLCKISSRYSRPMVENDIEEVIFNPGSYHCVKQLHNIALNELDQRHRGIFPIVDKLTCFHELSKVKFEKAKYLHLHPLYLMLQRPRLKNIPLHNFNCYILQFYANMAAPTLCADSIMELSNIVTWRTYNSYFKTINTVEDVTTPIFANRKEAMILYYPMKNSNITYTVQMKPSDKNYIIVKNINKPPMYDINGYIIPKNFPYITVRCSTPRKEEPYNGVYKDLYDAIFNKKD